MKNIKEMIKNLSVGDIVDITISDCGKGHAVIMDVSNDEITIKVDVDTFTCCYDCQTLVNSIFSVKVEEVYEINKIKEDNDMSKNVKEVKNVNVHAAGYLTKDKIREQIEALGGKPMSNHEFKSTKRDKLLEMLEKAKAQQPTIAEATKEVAPAQLDKRREKYNLFCHLVKTKALENQKKGYGHVVSAYMLCALILKADYGLEKLKGHEHEVTLEQRTKVKEVRNFMINKGHLKAVTWSYNNVTYYSPEYDGNNKNFMVPIEKAPKDAKLAVTTYKVMW